MKFRAAVLVESSKELAFEEVEFREKLSVGQVLVQIKYSGICGAQVNEIDAIKGPDKYLPHLLGHEGLGIVVDVGPGVSKVKRADQVILHWRKGSGIESTPARYFMNDKVVNSGWVTTFSDYSIVSENRLTKISSDDLGELKTAAPLLGCALTTALGVLGNDAQVGIRDHILLFGAGGVGLCVVALASLFGVRKLTVVDKQAIKLDIARKLGATSTVLFEDKDSCATKLQQIDSTFGFSVAIETSGSREGIELSYELSNSTARIILVGVPSVNNKISIHTLPLHFGKKIKGSHGGGSNPDLDIPFLLELMQQGTLNICLIPVNVYKLENVNEAILQIRSGEPGRAILEMSQ